MYLYGKETSDAVCDEAFLTQAFRDARQRCPAMVSQPVQRVVDVLDRLSKAWVHGSDYWSRAFDLTRIEVPFSDDMIAHSLDVIPELLHARNISARIKADFGGPDKLDRFVPSHAFGGMERAFPLGILFHVSAGNVFLGAIDSLLMGFLTKNVSIVKLSSRNLSFPMLFAESIRDIDHEGILRDKFSLIHFRSGIPALESLIKRESNGIIAWGGEEMIHSYKKGLPLGVKFIEYGPKISFQTITREALKRHGLAQAGTWVAQDIAMWDQAACASPQNLFVESGSDVSGLMDHVELALQNFQYARGRLSDDEHVEIHKEFARAEYNKIEKGGDFRNGKDYLLHYDPSPGLRTSPLNRSLIFKTYDSLEDLKKQLSPFARYLQSCSLLATGVEKQSMIAALGALGVMRFAHLGQVMQAPIGAPHDGKMTLVELTRIVPEEIDGSLEGLANDAIANVPFYRQLREGRLVTKITEMPLIRGADLDTANDEKLARFTHEGMHEPVSGGYIFSSGGTSGSPKYTVYTHREFSQVAELLAVGFRSQGIAPGTVVANLFVAGNLWSSFMAVDHAMAKIGAIVLPIGGLADKDQTLTYLERFKPKYVVGLPTQLVELARHAKDTGRAISMPAVLYAGEHLSVVARKFLEAVAGTTHFGSAGYASVDAGPIGYQCRFNVGGIHHLFTEDVHLEIINGEGVVTSRIKRKMPVIRLCTGDLLEWISEEDAACQCGSRDIRFRLLGRSDSQFNIWACRLFINDFEKALADCNLDGALFQIVLKQDQAALETIEFHIEHENAEQLEQGFIVDQVYSHSKDLQAQHPRTWVSPRLLVVAHASGSIQRISRTGKIKTLVDLR